MPKSKSPRRSAGTARAFRRRAARPVSPETPGTTVLPTLPGTTPPEPPAKGRPARRRARQQADPRAHSARFGTGKPPRFPGRTGGR